MHHGYEKTRRKERGETKGMEKKRGGKRKRKSQLATPMGKSALRSGLVEEVENDFKSPQERKPKFLYPHPKKNHPVSGRKALPDTKKSGQRMKDECRN